MGAIYEACWRKFWPGTPVVSSDGSPRLRTAATLRNAGIPHVRPFGARWRCPMDFSRPTARMERVSVESPFFDGVEYQYRLVRNIVRGGK